MENRAQPRFRFRLRTLLAAVAVACALLAAWHEYTTPRLVIEPVDDEHTRVTGRFFMRDGIGVCGMAVFYISPEPEPNLSWPATATFPAKETWWCLYEFDQTFAMTVRPEGRYDVRLSVPDLHEDYWFSFGDKTLPSLTDKPDEKEPWVPIPDRLKPIHQEFR